MSGRSFELEVLNERLAVSRLDVGAPIPHWATEGRFFVVSRTYEELSIVCDQDVVPADVRAERDWSCIQVRGPLAFAEVGILAALANILATANISIFAISTFDTDYLLVQRRDQERATASLRDAGHEVVVRPT